MQVPRVHDLLLRCPWLTRLSCVADGVATMLLSMVIAAAAVAAVKCEGRHGGGEWWVRLMESGPCVRRLNYSGLVVVILLNEEVARSQGR